MAGGRDAEGGAAAVLAAMARRIIRGLLPAEDRQMVAELDDIHRERSARDGPWAGARWYVRQAAGFVVRVVPARAREKLADGAGMDVRVAVRGLARRPGHVASFVATLGVGVGGVVTVYAVANGLLLGDVPGVEEPSGLITMLLGSTQAPPRVSWEVSHPDLETLRERNVALTALAGVTRVDVHVSGDDSRPRRMPAEMVTANYLDVLGAKLHAGRGLDLNNAEAASAVVVSHDFARFVAADPARAVGKRIRVNGVPFTVVGVTARGFSGAMLPGHASMWFPLAALPVLEPGGPLNVAADRRATVWRRLIGRLAPGATAADAESAANAAMEAVRVEYGAGHSFPATHFRLRVFDGVGLDPGARETVRRTLELLGAASLFLLLLAVANVANLSLARSVSARDSVAVRVALGADRARIMRPALVEGALLGLAGAAAALFASRMLAAAFPEMRVQEMAEGLDRVRIDGPVLAVTAALAIGAGVLAGIPGAYALSRHGVGGTLRKARHGDSAAHRFRAILAIVQVALSVVLLVGAGLLGRTVAELRAVDLGFAPDGILSVSIDPMLQERDAGRAVETAERVARALADAPEVRASGLVLPAPLRGSWLTAAVYPDGGTWEDNRVVAAGYFITPGFLDVLGVRTLAGDITALGRDAVVVTESLVRQAFPGTSPAAATNLLLHRSGDSGSLRIVGVIADVALSGVPEDPPPILFRQLNEEALRFGTISAWARPAPPVAAAPSAVLRAIASAAPELPVFDSHTARAAADRLHADKHLMARVASLLGALGLLLAAVGLYGVLGRAVSERTREIGVRAALGATPANLLIRVATSSLLLAAIGCAVGLPAALGASRALQSHLFGVHMTDAITYFAGVIVVLISAVAASLGPAIRAMRISPMEILRGD